jgi:hypothetical protein
MLVQDGTGICWGSLDLLALVEVGYGWERRLLLLLQSLIVGCGPTMLSARDIGDQEERDTHRQK